MSLKDLVEWAYQRGGLLGLLREVKDLAYQRGGLLALLVS